MWFSSFRLLCMYVCVFITIVLRHRVHRHTRHSGTHSHTLAIWIILHFDFFLTLSHDPYKVYLYWRKHRIANEMMAAWDDDFRMQFIKPKCTHTDGPTVTYGIRFYGCINAPIQLRIYLSNGTAAQGAQIQNWKLLSINFPFVCTVHTIISRKKTSSELKELCNFREGKFYD